jgi:hypothetical protein
MAKIASMKNQHERDCIISVDEMQIKERVCHIFSPTVLKVVTFNTICSDSDEFLVNLKKKQPPNLNAPSTSSLTLPTCSSTYTEHFSSK